MNEDFEINETNPEFPKNNGINEISYQPSADKKKAFPPFFITLAFSGILVILSVTMPKFQGLISFIAVVGLSIALYYYSRYIAATYIYSLIINSNGEPVFLVNKVAGKRSSLMFMSYLFDAESIQKFAKFGENKYSPSKDVKKHDFTMTYGIKEFYVIRFKTSGLVSDVMIECDEETVKTLSSYIEIAKEEYKEKD